MSKIRKTSQTDDLIKLLDSNAYADRLTAIDALGEIGDKNALEILRARMKQIGKEHYALIVAVGKMKKRLRVK